MGLFKKKEKIPTIPTAASLPALPALPPLESPEKEPDKKGLPELPSFPASPKNENLNQEIVKSAVADAPSNEEPELTPPLKPVDPITPQGLKPEEAGPQSPEAPLIPELPEISTVPETQTPSPPAKIQSGKENDPVFVRIDKFQAAQKNFEKIKSKVEEIELVLQKMKDVKSQEDEELKGWTEDTEKLKSRLAEIDSNLFSQL